MKKALSLCLTSFLVFMAANGHAEEWCTEDPCYYEDSCCVEEGPFYAKILGGANFLENTLLNQNKASYQTGYLIGGSLGYSWRYGLRLEVEYAYRRNAIENIHFFVEGSSKKGHYEASSYMGNLVWDVPLSSWGCTFWNTRPFIGAGIGYDFQQMHACNSRVIFSQKWRHFSWQLMAGLSYPLFCHTEVTLGYIFHQGGCAFCNHFLGVGLSYKFGFLR